MCDSLYSQNYSRVCGRILEQRGIPDALSSAVTGVQTTLDSPYADGVSLTHGPVGSRQHIWTFSSSLSESSNYDSLCTNTNYTWPYRVPSFISDKYFCDTGSTEQRDVSAYCSSIPLWNGACCGEYNTCCQFNNLLWFFAPLPQTSMDDLEVRICLDEVATYQDVVVFLIDLCQILASKDLQTASVNNKLQVFWT